MHAHPVVGPLAAATFLLAASMPGHAQTVHASLEGYQEVPALSSPGSGSFRARIDRHAPAIHWELTYGELVGAVLQAHVHFGQHGVNGGISVFLCTNLGNGPVGTPACPTPGGELSGVIVPASVLGPSGQGIGPGEFDELVAAIRRGITYVNVHSSLFPGGEIRGQIK